MIAIKLPYESNSKSDIRKIIQQYTVVVRSSYKRFMEGKKQKEVRHYVSKLNNIDLLNSWLIQCAVLDGQGLKKRFKDKKICFGGQKNFKLYQKGKISKEELKNSRLRNVMIQGESSNNGNRMFKLDIDNNKIIFKLNKKHHIELFLPNLRKNYRKKLSQLEEINKKSGKTYSIQLGLNHLTIIFDEFKELKEENKVRNRSIGIDMNPDTIGISIIDNNKIICTKQFSLKSIFDKVISSSYKSSDNKMKYYQNKLKHETLEISKEITKLSKHFKVSNVFIEDLKFEKSSHIKISNRKNKNLWKRFLFVNNLKKNLKQENINVYSVNPAYSSFIGNLQHDYTDAINASIEICRRGYQYHILKNKNGFYPIFSLKHRWKDAGEEYKDWKKFYSFVTKNKEMRYRVSLEDCLYNHNVFQLNSHKSMINIYTFY
jgi:predicted transposase